MYLPNVSANYSLIFLIRVWILLFTLTIIMTSYNCVLLKQLTLTNETQNICVKIDRMWKERVFRKPSWFENLEFILIDEEVCFFVKQC